MQRWDLFAYVTAFITIMLAIALTDMVQSLHRLLRERSRVKWDALILLLALWVFLWVVSEFFAVWLDARFQKITFYGLLGLLVVPTLTSLMAFAVLPDQVPEDGLDLEKFYFDNLGYFVVLLGLLQVTDIGRVMHYASRYDGFASFEPWIFYLLMWAVFFAFLALMYFVRARWAQFTALAVFLIQAHIGFGGAVIEALSNA